MCDIDEELRREKWEYEEKPKKRKRPLEDDEYELCEGCNGSGEGYVEFSRCNVCDGSGVIEYD